MYTGTARRSVRGHLQNVAPAAFVQMIAIERETCALGVRADGRQGTLFFVEGDLCDAVLDELRGEEAAIQILGWDRADVETQSIAERPARSINAPLTFILLEGMRRRDESSNGTGEHDVILPDTELQALARELDGVTSLCLVDLATGLPLEEHFTRAMAFDAMQLSHASHELVAAELALLSALGSRSALEEIVLTFGDMLLVIRHVRPGVLLVLTGDSSRLGLPAIRAALLRHLPRFAEDISTWLD